MFSPFILLMLSSHRPWSKVPTTAPLPPPPPYIYLFIFIMSVKCVQVFNYTIVFYKQENKTVINIRKKKNWSVSPFCIPCLSWQHETPMHLFLYALVTKGKLSYFFSATISHNSYSITSMNLTLPLECLPRGPTKTMSLLKATRSGIRIWKESGKD